MKRLKEIDNSPNFTLPVRIFVACMSGFIYTIFFNGSLIDGLASIIICLLTYLMLERISEFGFFQFLEYYLAGALIGGALGWLAYSLVLDITGSFVVGSFLGAFVVNLYSEVMARKIRTPASMFYVPGIFPLVPGITAYSTISHIVEKDFSEALNKGMLTLAIGGAIAFGIMLSANVIKFMNKVNNERI